MAEPKPLIPNAPYTGGVEDLKDASVLMESVYKPAAITLPVDQDY